MFTTFTAIQNLKAKFDRFVSEEKGATAIEYGLIAAGISVVIMGTVWLLGGTLDGVFQSVLSQLSGG